jgi:creatinine amidohydrolase
MVKTTVAWILSIIIYFSYPLLTATPFEKKALILQEMSWVDVQRYLKQDDMVIIPLGSTEQHGPHLPLGSDYFEAFEISKKISEQTGVLIAPILMVGYSRYHSGFPGTLSIEPETMEQVVFENVERLIQYGFRRFLFFNQHGGNNIVQKKLVHRINHTTEAIAIPIGVGSVFKAKAGNEDFFDWHAGKSETSMMLYLMPQLVRMERAEKPEIHFTSQMNKLRKLSEENPDLIHLWDELFGVPEEAKKGGASHQISSNGIWSLSDPKSATKKLGEQKVNWKVQRAVKFIEAWNRAKK